MQKNKLSKNEVYMILIFIGAIFILFYWTKLYFDNKYEKKLAEINQLQEQYKKVYSLYSKTINKTEKLNESLLVFIQDTVSKHNLSDKMASLKPQNISGSYESVILRLENLGLNETVDIIKDIDKFSNIKFNQINQSRRFDNEKKADLVVEIVKLK
ncbi:hypothetical protein LF845_11575 [Deferribacterales bacterium Es71-Z0220]|jgi:hypothetical protein|uniref:hypothetical protein n=1 Tax=Deferrivibrio essentukiensis TaxID=2880922 RepID=UPI001F62521E|nr:hypothetical protein [Deferrivibrio essentukiensis]MBZ4671818.1 hypothetical protein [Deferribacteraceae bacterium]MCB4205582.1 hypothetical protein [Deferrivibrio essentukiensis]